MLIQALEADSLHIPFKSAFTHASATRSVTQTILVKARSQEGIVGHGEGCPREYVTGETADSARAFVARHCDSLQQDVVDIESLKAWTESHRHEIDGHPSAWAGIELAILDLLGNVQHRPVEALLGVPAVCGRFRYSAVLGDMDPDRFAALLDRYRDAGFADYKIKLSGNPLRDRLKTDLLKAAGIAPTLVRADANNAWTDAPAAIEHMKWLDYPFHAIEEPLATGDYEGMLDISEQCNTQIVLDESFIRIDQFSHLAANPEQWVINLRVSKMGGLLRSLAIVERARSEGIRLNIGAHVGETSLLTRAGLTAAVSARDILLHQEGAFGTNLLAWDITREPLMFGAGGILDVGDRFAEAAGLGLAMAAA